MVFRFVMELAREQDTNTLAVLQYPFKVNAPFFPFPETGQA